MNEFRGRGNLAAAPTLKRIQTSGAEDTVPVAEMRIYFDRPKPDGDNGFTDKGGFWLDVTLWDRQAEIAARLLPKGARVVVEGSLLEQQWNDKETGEPRSKLALRASRVDLDLSRVESVTLRPSRGRAEEPADD